LLVELVQGFTTGRLKCPVVRPCRHHCSRISSDCQ
jgi:hypothetical protein